VDKRKVPTLRQIAAAAVAQLFKIPREHAKLMTPDQMLSLVHVDHDPVPFALARDLGWSPEQYNHPSNLTLRLIRDHRTKTASKDIPDLAKTDRIRTEHAEFQRRILAKAGADTPVGATRKLKRKITSRPFRSKSASSSRGNKWNR
jgi:hypothetical protein